MNRRTNRAGAAATASRIGVAAIAALLLQACASTRHVGPVANADDKAFNDFGLSVRQDIAAQIQEPNPAWKKARVTSDGKRACLAEKRYQIDAPVAPSLATTSSGQQLISGGGVTTANLTASCGGVPLQASQ